MRKSIIIAAVLVAALAVVSFQEYARFNAERQKMLGYIKENAAIRHQQGLTQNPFDRKSWLDKIIWRDEMKAAE